jgi:hypothetical protein
MASSQGVENQIRRVREISGGQCHAATKIYCRIRQQARVAQRDRDEDVHRETNRLKERERERERERKKEKI